MSHYLYIYTIIYLLICVFNYLLIHLTNYFVYPNILYSIINYLINEIMNNISYQYILICSQFCLFDLIDLPEIRNLIGTLLLRY